MSLLGIDIGTTGCKAAAFSEYGSLIALGYREYRKTPLKAGHAELNSHDVLNDIWDCINEVAGKTQKDPVTALSISSLGEAMTPVTKDRKIIYNSILCSDIRGDQYIQQLTGQISHKEFYSINPNIPGCNYSLPKLLWIKEHKPDVYDRTYKFLLWSDLVFYMLGGDAVTSYSLANRTLLFDIYKQDWSQKLLDLTGIDREKLPAIAPGGAGAGVINGGMARKLNLPENVKLVLGGHDQCCNALGAGVFQQGKTVCGMGTFECITPVYNSIPKHTDLFLENGLNIEHHVLPDRYVSFLYNQSGCLVKWYRDTFAAADRKLIGQKQDIYDFLITEIPSEPTNLLVLPHFEITGPPEFITDSCGVVAGLKTSTKRGEILKAIMECTTLYFVESLEKLKNIGLETSEFIATGGGAKSDVWLQIKADILGVPFKRLKQPECGLVGAAMIAGMATDTWKTYEQAASYFVRSDAGFEPDEAAHSYYREKYELYKKFCSSLEKITPKISGMSEHMYTLQSGKLAPKKRNQ